MLKAKQTWTIEMVNYELINTTLLGEGPLTSKPSTDLEGVIDE